MPKRFLSIWFPFLVTDWMARQNSELDGVPFILFAPERGRMIVKAASLTAQKNGIFPGIALADCRAIFPDIIAMDYPAGKADQLLKAIAIWCIRFTPLTTIDTPDGIVLDCSGCCHLWNGETAYASHILGRLEDFGYHARVAMTDTMSAGWGVSRFGKRLTIVPSGEQLPAMLNLPAAALRLEQSTSDRLNKLGLTRIGDFANMPRPALRKRFGASLLTRLDQVSGYETEHFSPVEPPKSYVERLPCMEPISTAKGISIAVEKLLDMLCSHLAFEGAGVRAARLRCFRVDGNIQEVQIGTNLPTRNTKHLFKLFELKTGGLRPDLGFELFELQATVVEPIAIDQAALWTEKNLNDTAAVAELLDKIISKRGQRTVRRYLPAEHYWPERSYILAESLDTAKTTEWRIDFSRPIHLLNKPAPIEVTVPMPDYPPMLFRYKGNIHKINRADGPERIEQEWWLQRGVFRDYYCVEDDHGQRYWLFREGSYDSGSPGWYIHGFFA